MDNKLIPPHELPQEFKWTDTDECHPSNNSKCIIELRDGTYTLAWQRFGEWRDILSKHRGYLHTDVLRWRDATEEDYKAIRNLLGWSAKLEPGLEQLRRGVGEALTRWRKVVLQSQKE